MCGSRPGPGRSLSARPCADGVRCSAPRRPGAGRRGGARSETSTRCRCSHRGSSDRPRAVRESAGPPSGAAVSGRRRRSCPAFRTAPALRWTAARRHSSRERETPADGEGPRPSSRPRVSTSRGACVSASIPTSRRIRASFPHPHLRFASAPRSSIMRGLGSEKKSSRWMPYERYGSCGSSSRWTARASLRDEGPFSGRTMRSVRKARSNGRRVFPPRAIV